MSGGNREGSREIRLGLGKRRYADAKASVDLESFAEMVSV